MKGARSSEGFSLLEMLVVLVIFSLVAGVVFSGFTWRKSNETLNTLGQKITHLVAEASLRAVTQGETARVETDITKRRITNGRSADDILVPEPFNILVRTGAELIEQRGIGTIEFFSDGTSSGGELVIAEPGGQSRSVRIYWLTGAITVNDGSGS